MQQRKPCYIYRFIACGTMEEAIYKRQVTKISMSKRVIDEQQVDRHFKRTDLDDLYSIRHIEPTNERNEVPNDSILSKLLNNLNGVIVKCHSHDSLLQNKEEDNLSTEEIQLAWNEFENEIPRGMKSHHSIKFPSLQIAPNSGPIASMNIHGFSTKELHRALSIKAWKDTGVLFVAPHIPALLHRFHKEMADNVFDVSNYNIEYKT